MSGAAGLAAAKKRRAGNIQQDTINTPPTPITNNKPASSGLPLQTIISTFNTRISKLENNTNNKQNSYDTNEEYEQRFNLLVEEISDLKEMVLKLQSFTMEVNKTLFDERIKVLSAESIINNTLDNQDIDDNDDQELNADIDKIKESVENIKLDA
tara:strand:- start:81 stop:545 length:465 start_codon:yes stop_codon:yes gene_type:complete